MRVNGHAMKCFDDHEHRKTCLLGRSSSEIEFMALSKTSLPWAELRPCLPAGLGEPGVGARRGLACPLFVGPSVWAEFVVVGHDPVDTEILCASLSGEMLLCSCIHKDTYTRHFFPGVTLALCGLMWGTDEVSFSSRASPNGHRAYAV